MSRFDMTFVFQWLLKSKKPELQHTGRGRNVFFLWLSLWRWWVGGAASGQPTHATQTQDSWHSADDGLAQINPPFVHPSVSWTCPAFCQTWGNLISQSNHKWKRTGIFKRQPLQLNRSRWRRRRRTACSALMQSFWSICLLLHLKYDYTTIRGHGQFLFVTAKIRIMFSGEETLNMTSNIDKD